MNELVINEFLQSFSNDFFDAVNKFLTLFGDELFFMFVAMVFFWCIDKRFGFKLINVYLVGAMITTVIKNVVKRERPYTKDGIFSIGEETSGYSFPSGHSHSISNLGTQVSLKYKKWYVIFVSLIMTVIIMFTRLYLGQHYLTDVLAGCFIGIISAILFSYLFEFLKDREEVLVYFIVPLCVIAAIIASSFNVTSDTLYDVCGGYAAVALGYYLEKKYIKYQTKTTFFKQILKIGIGGVILLALKEGLKYLFLAINFTNPLVMHSLRYFIIAFTAMFLVPLLFKKLKFLQPKVDADKNNDNSEVKEEA